MIGQTTATPVPETPDGPATTPAGEGVAADVAAGDATTDREYGGRDGPDPTRYGDWEKNGRCIDF
ncbi:MAG: DUF1674 domain-containing protein [Pseudomonadota bacterium]|nr:DUF1674 domain-containing protein [Pseudomonadota bacterium]